MGCPTTRPRNTRTGATNSATWSDEPNVTAIANSILFLYASWTATMCSARLPIVGMRITPTNSSDRPNCSMNGSIEPDEDLGQHGEERRRDEQHAHRDLAGPGGSSVALGLAVPAERRLGVRELPHERQPVADHQHERDEHGLLDPRALATRAPLTANTAGMNRPDGREDEQRRVRARDPLAERLEPVLEAAGEDARRRARAAGCR